MQTFLTVLSFALVFNLPLGFSVNNNESSSVGLNHANNLRSFHLNDSSISEECGGNLANPKGGIIYKVLGPIQYNEQCVWVIRGGRATTFYLDVLYTRNDSDAQILATCIRKSQAPTHVLINGTGPVSGISACNVVVITYSTNDNVTSSATGFVLQYSTVQGSNSISTSSPDYFLNANNPSVLRHPALPASTYSANELSTFTFVSKYSNDVHNPSSTIAVTYIKTQLETSCRDFLNVFYFNSTIRNWQPGVRICDTVAFQLITSKDAILLTFETSSTGQYAGFNLIHSATGCVY